MGDRIAVPAFGQHPDTDDAADVAARRMQGPLELARQLLEAFWVDGTTLRIGRPIALSDGVESEPHPAVLVVLRAFDVGLADHLRVDADRVHAAVVVTE